MKRENYMELISICKTLKVSITTISSLRKFVQNEMIEILKSFGEIHTNAAIIALENSKISNQPSREIESAINSLQESYASYIYSANKRIIFFKKTNMMENYKSACKCALLIASCYKCLKDKRLTELHVNNAKECFNLYDSIRSDITYADSSDAAMMGSTYPIDSSNFVEDELKEERKELEEVCKLLI